MAERAFLRDQKIPIAEIYVPAKRRGTLDAAKVTSLTDDMLQNGQQTPVLLRRDDARKDGTRYVLVEGLHRLEACKALGDTTIKALLVQAR